MKTYVLTLITYDYHTFTDLLFASNNFEKIIEYYKLNVTYTPLYFAKEVTEEQRIEFRNSEHKHCLITEFIDN